MMLQCTKLEFYEEGCLKQKIDIIKCNPTIRITVFPRGPNYANYARRCRLPDFIVQTFVVSCH